MKNWPHKFAVVIILVCLTSGCASTHKTTTTETVVSNPDRDAVSHGDHNIPDAERSETTTTTAESNAEHPGILGSTLHAVGYVISLPFIAIGGLFRIIFGG